ncbi:MAG: hypothetical protein ACRCX2_18405 [Paraclostridium sp.]
MQIDRIFLGASQTGKEIFILKAIGQCDCFDPDDLINSEPDPHCLNCFGTGQERVQIKTDKLRYDYTSNTSNSKINDDIIESTEELFVFYIPTTGTYSGLMLDNDDIVYTTDTNSKFFEVINRFEYILNDFSYHEVVAKKIPHINGVVTDA